MNAYHPQCQFQFGLQFLFFPVLNFFPLRKHCFQKEAFPTFRLILLSLSMLPLNQFFQESRIDTVDKLIFSQLSSSPSYIPLLSFQYATIQLLSLNYKVLTSLRNKSCEVEGILKIYLIIHLLFLMTLLIMNSIFLFFLSFRIYIENFFGAVSASLTLMTLLPNAELINLRVLQEMRKRLFDTMSF